MKQLFILLVFATRVFNTVAQPKVDSLQKELSLAVADTQKINILNLLAAQTQDVQPDKAKEYGEEMLRLSEKNNHLRGKAQANMSLGITANNKGDYETALEHYQKAETCFLSLNDSLSTGKVYNNMGQVYVILSNYVKALDVYLKSLKIMEDLNKPKLITICLNNIGRIYRLQKNYPKALEYYERCIELNKKTGDEKNTAFTYNNIGTVYFEQKKFPEAILNYMEGMKIREKLKDTATLASSYNNLANAYCESKQLAAGLTYQLKALAIREYVGDKRGIAMSYTNLGSIYMELGDHQKALKYEEDAIILSTKINSKEVLMSAYETMVQLHSKMNDYKKALYFQQQLNTVKDSVFNLENSNQIAQMQTLYETEKLTKEKLEAETENLKLSNETLIANKQRNTAVYLILVLLITAGGGMYILRQKQKTKLAKRRQEEERNRIAAMISSEEKERIRIARELHDGLGQILSTARLNAASLEESIAAEDSYLLSNTINLIDNAVTEVRAVSHNLMPVALSEKGLIPAINELAVKISDSKAIRVEIDHTDFKETVPQSVEIVIYRVIQEVLNNMIRHANAKTVNIQLKHINNQLGIRITDDGKGFDPEKIETSTGIGWKNILTRLSLVNGKLNLNSIPGEGTSVQISIAL